MEIYNLISSGKQKTENTVNHNINHNINGSVAPCDFSRRGPPASTTDSVFSVHASTVDESGPIERQGTCSETDSCESVHGRHPVLCTSFSTTDVCRLYGRTMLLS